MYKFLLLFLPLFSFGQSPSALLWEISGNGLEKPSYLFGTIHLNDRELFNFSDSVYIALEKVDGIMLETDVSSVFENYDSRYGNVNFTFDRNGKPYVSNVNASHTKFGTERGMPQFMDAYFQQYGENTEKDIYTLRTIENQNTTEIDPNTNVFKYENRHKNHPLLVSLYHDGDVYIIDRYIRTKLNQYDVGYENNMMEKNHKMVLKLDTILKSQRSVFCAIGVGHLAGKNGHLELLTKMGYSVRRVESTYSENNQTKQKVKSFSFYPVNIDSLKLRAVFPGTPIMVYSENEDYDFKMIYREYGQGNTYVLEFHSLKENENLSNLAEKYIACPKETDSYNVELKNGGEGVEGLSDAYPTGYYWTRVLLSEGYFVVLKAYGGNLFMASQRAQQFFQQVELN